MTNKDIQTIGSALNKSTELFWNGRQVDGFVCLVHAVTLLFENQLWEMYRAEFETYEHEGTIHRDGLTFDEWRKTKGIE